jgi:hypothetical protein
VFTWEKKFSKKELQVLAGSKDHGDPIKAALEKEILKFGVDEKKWSISILDHVLSPKFPEARILRFGYNSDWFINAPVKTAEQIASKLVNELARVRSNGLVWSEDSL